MPIQPQHRDNHTNPTASTEQSTPVLAVPTKTVNQAVQILQALVKDSDAFMRGPHGFIGQWIAFNTLYGRGAQKPEREQILNCIKTYVSNETAERLLNDFANEIAFFADCPPGDMRYQGDETRFRVRTRRDMATVCNGALSSSVRLAHLIAVVYQIRCNLIHGQKNPEEIRSNNLIEAGSKILHGVLVGLLNQR